MECTAALSSSAMHETLHAEGVFRFQDDDRDRRHCMSDEMLLLVLHLFSLCVVDFDQNFTKRICEMGCYA